MGKKEDDITKDILELVNKNIKSWFEFIASSFVDVVAFLLFVFVDDVVVFFTEEEVEFFFVDAARVLIGIIVIMFLYYSPNINISFFN